MAVDGLNELFFWVGCRSLLLDLIPENKEDLIFFELLSYSEREADAVDREKKLVDRLDKLKLGFIIILFYFIWFFFLVQLFLYSERLSLFVNAFSGG